MKRQNARDRALARARRYADRRAHEIGMAHSRITITAICVDFMEGWRYGINCRKRSKKGGAA